MEQDRYADDTAYSRRKELISVDSSEIWRPTTAQEQCDMFGGRLRTTMPVGMGMLPENPICGEQPDTGPETIT